MKTAACLALFACALCLAFQRPFRQYPGDEYEDFDLPANWQEKTEWVFARLMSPPARGYRGGRGWRRAAGRDWTAGYFSWTNDYPRADRHFLQALRRLTRLNARTAEQPVNLDDGADVYD